MLEQIILALYNAAFGNSHEAGLKAVYDAGFEAGAASAPAATPTEAEVVEPLPEGDTAASDAGTGYVDQGAGTVGNPVPDAPTGDPAPDAPTE